MKICKAPQIELFPFELSSKINHRHTPRGALGARAPPQSGDKNGRNLQGKVVTASPDRAKSQIFEDIFCW